MSDALVSQFRELGVPDPEGWARSQREEGIDQIARATVLRRFADIVAGAPGYWDGQTGGHVTEQVRAAAERISASSAASQDLALVLKSALWEVMFEVIGYVEGTDEDTINPAEIEIGLFRVDEDGEAESQIDALHESWRDVASAVLGSEVIAA